MRYIVTAMATGPCTRRGFGRKLAQGLAASTLLVPGMTQTLAPVPVPAAGEVAAKTARILALYGSRLTAEQKQRVQRTVAGHVAMLERIRGEAMPNCAPPATVLRLVRGGGDAQR